MTHSLIAPESIDQALFMSQVLIEPTIVPRLDAEFGAANRINVLQKVLPFAGQAIEQNTPMASQAMVDISRRVVRHEALLPDDYPKDIKDTLHGDNLILLYEPPLPAERVKDKVPNELSPEESEIVIEAAKLVALSPKRRGDDLVALDFLARNSEDVEGRVSKFILERTREHRRTRTLLTGLLLRIL